MQFASVCPDLSRVYAFEPDARSYKKMVKNLSSLDVTLSLYNAALGNADEERVIFEKGNRNTSLYASSASDSKEKKINVLKLDSVLGGASADFIKLDVEGAEEEAISGARNTISNFAPDMQISLYHRPSDMFKLIPLVKDLYDDAEIYVKKTRYIPAWDFNMYLINKNKI